MNCKSGDLAVYVRGKPESNIGHSVICIEVYPHGLTFEAGNAWIVTTRPTWKVDRNTAWYSTPGCGGLVQAPYAIDSLLMPIRPDALEDEDDAKEAEKPVARQPLEV